MPRNTEPPLVPSGGSVFCIVDTLFDISKRVCDGYSQAEVLNVCAHYPKLLTLLKQYAQYHLVLWPFLILSFFSRRCVGAQPSDIGTERRK